MWLLLADTTGPTFFAEEVYRMVLPGAVVRNGLPLFRDHSLAEAFALELAASGGKVEVVAVPRPVFLTDLLTQLRDFGVTHVGFDPRGTALNLVTIDRAIMGLYLFD